MKNHKYRITVEYSDEDNCYIARVPAFKYCAAHGDTPEEAVHEVQDALEGVLASMKDHGDEIPEEDIATEEIRRYAHVISVSKLARAAGLNQHTLASKLRRKTRFTSEESAAIRNVLEKV